MLPHFYQFTLAARSGLTCPGDMNRSTLVQHPRATSRSAAAPCRFYGQPFDHPGHPVCPTTGGSIPLLLGGEGRDEGGQIFFPQGLDFTTDPQDPCRAQELSPLLDEIPQYGIVEFQNTCPSSLNNNCRRPRRVATSQTIACAQAAKR